MKEKIELLNIGEVKFIDFKKYSTYKVGGESLVVFVNSLESLIKLMSYLNDNDIKYKVIGNASNLIMPDKGYSGVVISLSKINYVKRYNNYFTVSSGYSLIKFSTDISYKGYTGLEFATGIPGTMGGAIFMNAGGFGSCISNVLYKIRVLTPDLKIKTLYNKDLMFSYRNSLLRMRKDYICLDATFKLEKDNIDNIKFKLLEFRNKRLNTQPLEFPSAGSVFKNPEGYSSGKLIEDLSLKGYHIGDAFISDKHANFIVNKGNATSNDIVSLINYIKEKVKEKYDIDLECEQEIVE